MRLFAFKCREIERVKRAGTLILKEIADALRYSVSAYIDGGQRLFAHSRTQRHVSASYKGREEGAHARYERRGLDACADTEFDKTLT